MKKIFDFQHFMCIQVKFFWVVMLCNDVVAYQCFGGPCCLHFQGKMNSTAKEAWCIKKGQSLAANKKLERVIWQPL
jgi:hypothetical protein